MDPSALAVDPAGRFRFVANRSTSDVSAFVINQTSGALTAAPNSPYAAGMGFNPNVLTTDPFGKFLYVGNTYFHMVGASKGELDVYSIDPVTSALTPSANSLTTPAVGPSNPVGIFAHPSGKWLYVLGAQASLPESVIVQQFLIDPTTGELGGGVTYNGIEQARSLGATPTGAFIYLGERANRGGIETIAISPVNGSLNLVADLPLQPFFPNSITVDPSARYVFSTAGTYSIDPMTSTLSPNPNNSNLASNGFVPWVADRIGEFVFTGDPAGKSAVLNSFQIDSTSGLLTAAPGSPYTTSAVVQAIAVTSAVPPGFAVALVGPLAASES